MNRFDTVTYDVEAQSKQKELKSAMLLIEASIERCLPDESRSKALALTKLEEAYTWIGKALRDDQISRSSSVPLEEQVGVATAVAASSKAVLK